MVEQVPHLDAFLQQPSLPAVDARLYHNFTLQWSLPLGRAVMYVNGQLSRRMTGLSATEGAPAGGLSLGLWFPNAWAGSPEFDACEMLVKKIKVTDIDVAKDRWCTPPVTPIACTADVDCSAWVHENCLMAIQRAYCVLWDGSNVCEFVYGDQVSF